MLWVIFHPHIHLKIHNSFNFWGTSVIFNDFLCISFLHMLTRNEVSWWNSNSEQLPWSDFCAPYAPGENLPILSKRKSWLRCKFSSFKVWMNFHLPHTGRKFSSNVWRSRRLTLSFLWRRPGRAKIRSQEVWEHYIVITRMILHSDGQWCMSFQYIIQCVRSK